MSTDKNQPVMDQEWIGTEEYEEALEQRPHRVLVSHDGQCTPLMPVRSATEAILGGFQHIEEQDLNSGAAQALGRGDPIYVDPFPERNIMKEKIPEHFEKTDPEQALVVMAPMSTPAFTSRSLTEQQLRGHAMRRLMAKVDELTVSMIRTLAESDGDLGKAFIEQAPPEALDEPSDVGMSLLASGALKAEDVNITIEYIESLCRDDLVQLVFCPAVDDNVVYPLAAPPCLGRLVALSPPIVRSARLKGGQLYVWAEANLGAAAARESIRLGRLKHAVDETEEGAEEPRPGCSVADATPEGEEDVEDHDDAEAEAKGEGDLAPGCKPGVETVPCFHPGTREIVPTPRRGEDVKSDVKAPVDECAAFGVINKSATAHCCFSNTVVRNEPDGETTNVCECIDSPMEDESDQWAYRIAFALNQAEE